MAYLEELLPEFRNGAKIRRKCWTENLCISLQGSCGLNINFYDVNADDWEVVLNKSIDWQYIIDHRCLCKFWNKKGCEVLGFLKQIRYYKDNDFHAYISLPGAIYTKCCPVRRDEVTFYEDKDSD